MHTLLERVQSTRFDVIIVGAGPAGSSAGYHFAKAGCDVLLVDRATFPRAKACGDAVMPPALAELAQMGLLAEVQQRFHRVSVIGRGIREILVTLPLANYEGFAEGYIAPRDQFDQILCEHACQHGATLLQAVTLSSFAYRPDGIVIRGTGQGISSLQLYAQLLIIADGSASRLAQQLRTWHFAQPSPDTNALTLPHTPTPQRHERAHFSAIRGYLSMEINPDALAFYFPTEGDVHYYWAFPVNTNNLVNVGVIATLAQTRATSDSGKKIDLRQRLHTFFHKGPISQLRAAPIATGLRDSALYGERILCVGDAAALAEPGYAEGISAALWSGRMAAQIATDALRRGDVSRQTLRSYGQLVRQRYDSRFAHLLEDPVA